jgi:riboflavin kinase / FMN adenylyltransferase
LRDVCATRGREQTSLKIAAKGERRRAKGDGRVDGKDERFRQDVPVPERPDLPSRTLWSGSVAPPADLPRTVVTIGVFDGVHRGHQVIVSRAVALARASGLPCVVLTFDPHPGDVVRPGTRVPMLSTVAHRIELLYEVGADAVWVLPFTLELSQLTAEEFVLDVLVARLHAQSVVVGANFHFGHRAAGRVETLIRLGETHDFAVESVELVGGAGFPAWSSTQVRERVFAGDVVAAAEILGRPHRVEGEVVHGDHRGSELGYPTANLRTAPDAAFPADGVYAGWLVRAGGERLPAAISVGTNPTFDGADRRVEAYVLDRTDLDLYGEWVAVEFANRLRGMERFDSVDGLLVQMSADVAAARTLVG